MKQNETLPGNDSALQERHVRHVIDDIMTETIGAGALLEVLAEYTNGNEKLMSNDPWNAGFWAVLQAAQDRMQKALASAEAALVLVARC